jgi:hypothetical protein
VTIKQSDNRDYSPSSTVSVPGVGIGLALPAGRAKSRGGRELVTVFTNPVKASVAAGVTWTALNASLFVFVSFAPGVLIAHGYSVGRAGVLGSLAIWVTLLSIPLGGYIADRTGSHYRMIAVGALATAVC